MPYVDNSREETFWSRRAIVGECWNWTGYVESDGYGRLYWRGQRYRVPRLAWQLARGPIPAGLLVCHKCDNPLCFNPDHLFLGTGSENVRDAVAKGRWRGMPPHRYGELASVVKVTAAQVQEMRALYPTLSQRQLASKFQLSKTQVARILHRTTWRWLPAGPHRTA